MISILWNLLNLPIWLIGQFVEINYRILCISLRTSLFINAEIIIIFTKFIFLFSQVLREVLTCSTMTEGIFILFSFLLIFVFYFKCLLLDAYSFKIPIFQVHQILCLSISLFKFSFLCPYCCFSWKIILSEINVAEQAFYYFT